ncbi:ADP-ribose pyrophosphatase [Leptolyngbyaceae cyanobacterium JSC-12]|nr:ADP-ribose pyrophosphatase [Leptolyngbyaceae cyanobacterium JSC-12]
MFWRKLSTTAVLSSRLAGAPLQIPGGGVDSGESLEQALHQEIWEESGLKYLIVIRKLGVAEIC